VKALLIVESCFGATAALVEEVAAGLRQGGAQADVIPAARAQTVIPDDISLLVLAAPTHNRGLPTPASRRSARARGGAGAESGIREWLETATISQGVRVAALDTVTSRSWISGSAAKRIARALGRRSPGTVTSVRSFLVTDQGPADGETEQARAWGRALPTA